MLSFTLLLYMSIFYGTTFFASKSQRFLKDGSVRFDKRYFLAAFFIHWFFLVFTNSGTDHEQYVKIIENDAIVYFGQGLEIGFNGLCIALYSITHSGEICIFIIKTITIILFYYSFYLIRDHLNLGLAVLAFNVFEYLSSIYIIAYALAIAIVLLGSVCIFTEKKWYIPLALSLLASTIHASSLIIFVLFAGIIVSNKLHFRIGLFSILFLLVISTIVLKNIGGIFSYAVTNIIGFEQYEDYDASLNKGVGFFNYIVYSYIFIVLMIPLIKSDMPSKIRVSSVALFVFGFISSMMGYYLNSTRLNYYSIMLYAIAIPYYLHYQSLYHNQKRQFLDYGLQKATWIMYLVFVGIVALKNATDPQSTSMLFNYHLFNPFS